MKVASTARRIFDPQGKKTFATISANSDLTHCSKRRPIRAHREGPLGRWRPVRSERGKQTSRIGRECEHRLILGSHEALADAPADHLAQRVKIPLHVQKAARLLMNAQLGPRPLLENLFEGAGSARQRDEAVG